MMMMMIMVHLLCVTLVSDNNE